MFAYLKSSMQKQKQFLYAHIINSQYQSFENGMVKGNDHG